MVVFEDIQRRVADWSLVEADPKLVRAFTEVLPPQPKQKSLLSKWGITTTHLRLGAQVKYIVRIGPIVRIRHSHTSA